MESPVEGTKMTQLMNGQVEELREPYNERPSSPSVAAGVSGKNEYQRVSSSDYQSGPLDYQSTPSSEYQPVQEYHTGQQEYQEYQSATEYQASPQEYQTVQPEYHPLPLQPPPPPRSPAYGSPTRGVPLRRTESRTFVPAPPQQRSGSPLNFQPQNYQRPPPNNYRPSGPQPPNQAQHFRPQLQRRAESPTQNQDYQRIYINQPEKKPLNFNPVPRDSQAPQPQPQSPQNSQSPPVPRQAPPQNIVRRPNPWALLKQKLPADVRQQFVPIRRPQFEGRPMQSPDQNAMQRPPGDGQPINTGMGRGSPNPGMQNPNPGMQSPPPNPMYNGRPPSGNPPPKMGVPMQRPIPQEGRESPSPHQPQGVQRVMSGGERRQPYDMQRTDSVRNMEPRGMTPPQPGMYSPSPPRPMGERGRETPPGPPRTPKDDDDDVVYSSANDPRMNRGQTPTMRPPSGPRPGLPPDLNRDISTPRPLSRTESRQSFEVRTPSGLDNRGEPKLIPRESPLARPLSSDIAKTPFQYRPESQNTPPPSPKPDFQSPRPQSISPQDSLDRQRIESRGLTPNNPIITPKPSPDLRQNSRSDDSKPESGKLTPVGGEDTRTSPIPPTEQTNKPVTPATGIEKPSPLLSGSVSPALKSNEPSRTGTPLSVGVKDNQENEFLNSKSPDISQNISPTPTKGSESGTGTPFPDKDSGSHSREDTPNKTPDIIENVDNTNKTERPKSLKRSPSLKQDLANSPDNEGRKTPLVRTPSRASSAGKGNDLRSPLQRKPSGKRPKTPKTPDGDHDSGVDENTQRKNGPTTNGDLTSPTKSPSKIPAPKKLSTLPSPTKSTKGSPKTPEAPPTADKKKVPMNKIQVGAAPSPNLKTIKSKIGSLQNATHKPGGGNVKIEHRKLDWKAEPRIAAKNDTYQPGGGDKKIPQVKLKWEAKPKVGSLDNATHKPGGGEKKIESVKLDFKDKAKPKVGSKDNIKHQPGGGNVKTPSQDGSQDGNPGDIEDQKLEVKAQSKIGSLENVKHKPGGGDRKIFDDKEYLRQMSGATSRAASEGIPSGTQDGWSSVSTSRRTSRDRRTSGDRRYRSESRLGLRTPEPRMGISPKDEHCSLWERHERETKTLAHEEETSAPDPVSPSQQTVSKKETSAPDPVSSSQQTVSKKNTSAPDPVSSSQQTVSKKETSSPDPESSSQQTVSKKETSTPDPVSPSQQTVAKKEISIPDPVSSPQQTVSKKETSAPDPVSPSQQTVAKKETSTPDPVSPSHQTVAKKETSAPDPVSLSQQTVAKKETSTPDSVSPSHQTVAKKETSAPDPVSPSQQTVAKKETSTPDPVSPSHQTVAKKEISTPDLVSLSQQTVAKNTSDDKDLNSNKPFRDSIDTDENHESKPNINTTCAYKKITEPKSKESDILTVGKDIQEEVSGDKKKDLEEPTKVEDNPQKVVDKIETPVSLDTNSSKTNKEENLNKTAGLEMVANNTKQKQQDQNVQRKPESKEDLVREIKEIDSKEVDTNKTGISNLSNNVNNRSNTPDDKGANANLNPPLNESTTTRS